MQTTIKIAKSFSLLSISFWLSLCLPVMAHAYFTTLATGENLETYQFRYYLETQVVMETPSGINMVGHIDYGLREEISIGGHFGVGAVDFHLGGRVKWVPYPDTSSQPAIGVIGELSYANIAGDNELTLRAHPLVSKKIPSKAGKFIAYASLPIGLRNRDSKSTLPVNLNLGTEFRHKSLRNLRFLGEVGFDIHESFHYVSLAVSFPFDEENGILLD